MSTLDIDTVQAFLLVAELQSFTRTAEALGTTQASVSLKLQRLEAVVGRRLVERSPRSVTLTADGAAFLHHARALMEAHDRALSGEAPARQVLSLGISDHAGGPELVPLLERLHAMSSQLALNVTIGFSREITDAYDGGEPAEFIHRQPLATAPAAFLTHHDRIKVAAVIGIGDLARKADGDVKRQLR